jgi:tRNA threonylcarbamoyl adenosine modification protein YeaZ
MKILGVDTSTKYLSLGAYIDGAVYEHNLEVGPKLSSLITLAIKRVLDALSIKVSDFDYFASGLGPGSFTGIRVGLSTIKGMSLAIRKPIIGVSSLDVIAMNALKERGLIIPAVDAKRNLIYSCVYKNNKGSLKKISPYMLISSEGLISKLKSPCSVFGDALNIYREEILRQSPSVNLLDKDFWYPKAHNLIDIALSRIKADKHKPTFDAKPIYLFPKECQIKNAY